MLQIRLATVSAMSNCSTLLILLLCNKAATQTFPNEMHRRRATSVTCHYALGPLGEFLTNLHLPQIELFFCLFSPVRIFIMTSPFHG
jgi:hypothetical protein